MKINIELMGSVTVVAPCGAITQEEVNQVASTLEEQRLRTNGRLVMDFSNVPFLDSQGVEAVWDFSDQQRQRGQSAKLASVPELCREILELTGLVEQLDVFDSTESAVRSFV
jgi:stage II sporulation protein AA (anti-sigma F factor antagonist)